MATPQPHLFRLTVLNPGGRDPQQHFRENAGDHDQPHAPVNFHAYAACTAGSFQNETLRAIAEETPVLLLLRGNFRATEAALQQLKKAGRQVAVSLKETGLHQIAAQLQESEKLSRFLRIVRMADGCIGATPEAADFYRQARGESRVAFIPTPYPVADQRWDFSQPVDQRTGIFVGTREWDVPSRNHLAALLLARRLSETTDERVTVYNFDGRKGARRLAELGFAEGNLHVHDRKIAYVDYLREIARHKIVLQLDTSFVPGQVAGDALLCRVPCVGGNGAIDRLAFPDTCGFNRSIAEIGAAARELLTDGAAYDQAMESNKNAAQHLSFATVAEQLRTFFTAL